MQDNDQFTIITRQKKWYFTCKQLKNCSQLFSDLFDNKPYYEQRINIDPNDFMIIFNYIDGDKNAFSKIKLVKELDRFLEVILELNFKMNDYKTEIVNNLLTTDVVKISTLNLLYEHEYRFTYSLDGKIDKQYKYNRYPKFNLDEKIININCIILFYDDILTILNYLYNLIDMQNYNKNDYNKYKNLLLTFVQFIYKKCMSNNEYFVNDNFNKQTYIQYICLFHKIGTIFGEDLYKETVYIITSLVNAMPYQVYFD